MIEILHDPDVVYMLWIGHFSIMCLFLFFMRRIRLWKMNTAINASITLSPDASHALAKIANITCFNGARIAISHNSTGANSSPYFQKLSIWKERLNGGNAMRRDYQKVVLDDFPHMETWIEEATKEGRFTQFRGDMKTDYAIEHMNSIGAQGVYIIRLYTNTSGVFFLYLGLKYEQLPTEREAIELNKYVQKLVSIHKKTDFTQYL